MMVFALHQVTSSKFKLKCPKGTQVLLRLLVRDNRPYMTMLQPDGEKETEERYFALVYEGKKIPDGVDAKVIDSYVGPNGYFALLYEYTPKSVQRKRKRLNA